MCVQMSCGTRGRLLVALTVVALCTCGTTAQTNLDMQLIGDWQLSLDGPQVLAALNNARSEGGAWPWTIM